MPRLNDEELGRLLREFPRERASPDFTARLLEELSRTNPGSKTARNVPWLRRVSAAGAMAAVLVALFWSVTSFRDREHQSRTRERLQAIRGEYEKLQEDLSKLRVLAEELDELEPVVQLGGTEEVDFVIDLGEMSDLHGKDNGAAGGESLRPVSDSPRSASPGKRNDGERE